MKKQDVAAWRGKNLTEIQAEIKRLSYSLATENDSHTATKQRRDVARLKTIAQEKITYQSESKHE